MNLITSILYLNSSLANLNNSVILLSKLHKFHQVKNVGIPANGLRAKINGPNIMTTSLDPLQHPHPTKKQLKSLIFLKGIRV